MTGFCIGGLYLGHHFAGQRYQQLAADGDPGFTPADLSAEDQRAASAMFATDTREGRQQAGTLVGVVVGASLCGPFAPVAAWLGFRWGDSQASAR